MSRAVEIGFNGRETPEYYPGMHQDGYDMAEILGAQHKKMNRSFQERRTAELQRAESARKSNTCEIDFTSEVKTK